MPPVLQNYATFCQIDGLSSDVNDKISATGAKIDELQKDLKVRGESLLLTRSIL